ncbi:MAG: tRNA 2-thiouridine(34) synthase MnmA [Lachnospirales bacterium]
MIEHQKILVAMSGGVDSSVSACLLQEAGYDCEGVTMRLYRNEDIGLSRFHPCCSQEDIDDAADVAFSLDIPFHVADFTAEFRMDVIEPFICTYESGGTPNPCIECNRHMKFHHLLDFAAKHGCDAIATGHYARIDYDPKQNRWLLKKAVDESKDQSYVLYMLTQLQLARIRLPLGGLQKIRVRELAEARGLTNARKHDSQDICFVPDGDYVHFMEQYTGRTHPAGDFLDLKGRVVGRHQGAVRYTLGQRKGLGLAMNAPVYVCDKCMTNNTVTVGPEQNLYRQSLLAGEVNWIPFDAPAGPLRVTACIRYHQKEQPATVSMTRNGKLRVVFDAPQRAVTPGQAVVLYQGDLVLGGGTIEEAF